MNIFYPSIVYNLQLNFVSLQISGSESPDFIEVKTKSLPRRNFLYFLCQTLLRCSFYVDKVAIA